MSRNRAAWLGLFASVLMITGCTGIPDSSAPQVVRSVQRTPASDLPLTHITPQPGEGPDTVVGKFLDTGVDADAGHSASRQFLTSAANRRWQDSQTVILDEAKPGDVTFTSDGAQVPVTGRRVGQLDANGVFTPILKRMGAGDVETFNYGLIRVAGQWRINQLQPSVVISAQAFGDSFQQRSLYFFDSSHTILVPDLRYSSLTGQALASWLLAELLLGPRPELTQSVLNEVPDQVGKPAVLIGNPIMVEMPGTAQLDLQGRSDLAAQLAFTLGRAFSDSQLELTDSGKPVRVPGAPNLPFGTADFPSVSPDSVAPDNVAPDGGVYFIRDGAMVDSKGLPVPLGQNAHDFSSVALRRISSESMLAAGVTTSGQLLIGDDRGLTPISVPKVTSRPEWRPFFNDVWLGAGARGGIYRVSPGEPAKLVSVSSQVGTLPIAPVTALRFSPDGDRIAVVIRGADGVGEAWIGSVVTSGSGVTGSSDVRIDSLEPLTPPALAVTDLAWADSTKLLLVAAEPGAEAQVCEIYSDGSKRDPILNTRLPGPPTAIAAVLGQPLVVSAGGTIWTRIHNTWTSISGTGAPVAGINPVYAP
ncbi:MAG: LpqB family beta-propeller domain-containing protein [Jatrophihabitantaceae bacterium]